jgi:hypothetical protein
LKKTFKFKKSSWFALIIVIAIFTGILVYIIKFPQNAGSKNNADKSELVSNLRSWQDYEELSPIQVESRLPFDHLKDEVRAQYHLNFLLKVQKCLLLNLSHYTEMQYVQSLLNGARRDAILRGFLASSEVTKLLEQKITTFVSKEVASFSRDFNRDFLLRDDFELPPDISMYEVKLALIDELLNAADAHQETDLRLFYLWSALILQKFKGNAKLDLNVSHEDLVRVISQIPRDHLVAEVALAVCAQFDVLKSR